MIKLENEKLAVSFDDAGRVISFKNKANGWEIIDSPADDPFFMVLSESMKGDDCKEVLVFAQKQHFTATSDAKSVSFTASGLKIDNGRDDAGCIDITVTLHAELSHDSIVFSADIENNSGMMITDFEYPRLGVIKSLGDGKPALYWPSQPGDLYMNIGAKLSNMYRHRENGSNCMKLTYPGGAISGMYALLDKKSSLFVEMRDPDFMSSTLKVIGDPENPGAITLTMNKHLCHSEGCMSAPPVVVRLYEGSWHYGAKCYADWMRAYRPAHTKPDWIREMTGYFLVINKQQFGYEMWDYTTLPKLWELAKAHGCSTLALFGWYQSGHDNNYPDLEVSKDLGGEEALKAGIKAVQNAGGRVTLYYQGHLIDTGSDYYKSGKGERVACKTVWGSPYTEFYIKSHRSDFLEKYSRKTFVIGCPSCPEWRELMTERQKWLAELGADGTIYDQIGGMPPYVCFDESHPHDGGNPARALPGGQVRLVRELQTGAKAIRPDFAFMSEHITDLYSAYLDAVHGIGNMPGARGDRANAIGSESGSVRFPDVFRYCFPEAIITLRNTNPFIDRRPVNYAFTFGFPIELEVRYRADREDVLADKFAEKREYARKVADLREKYTDVLAKGTYRDSIGIRNNDPTLIAKGYESDGTLAVTLWNDSLEACTPAISVDDMHLVRFETADGTISDSLCALAPDSVAVAIYKQ